jgi:periplasmic protein TonB
MSRGHRLSRAALMLVGGSLLSILLSAGCATVSGGGAPAPTPGAPAPGSGRVPVPWVRTGGSSSPGFPAPDDSVEVEVMPILVTPPRPVYPAWARATEAQGLVIIRALVGKDGRISDCFVTEGPAELREAALAAVRVATFEPARQKGAPIAVWIQIPIRFSLH